MPVKIQKTDGGYRVSTPHGVKAHRTTKEKAQRQARLLRAVDHGWKPTHESQLAEGPPRPREIGRARVGGLTVRVAEETDNSGRFLSFKFNGTFNGKPLRGMARYGMQRADMNTLDLVGTEPELDDLEQDNLYDLLTDAPSLAKWAFRILKSWTG